MADRERLLTVLAGMLVLGIGAQWLAWRFRVPAIIFLVAAGFLAGPVTGFIQPDEQLGALVLPVVSLSVGLILFEGGLNLRFRELRQIGVPLIGLLTVGVVVTWLTIAFLAKWILGLASSASLLLGAILVVTGPTVIGPLLREIRPSGRLAAIAKWEGIVIDPLGATLAVLVFEAGDALRYAGYSSAFLSIMRGLVETSAIGTAIGVAAAWLLAKLLGRYAIPDYLQNPATLMFVVGAFTVAESLHHESGLLAVTVMGIVLANQRRVSIHRILEFKENLTVLLISGLFILLVSRVPLDSLKALGWRGWLFAVCLVIVVRPVAVWASTIAGGLRWQERIFLAWFAPRGIVAAAVSSVFAIRMGTAGLAIAPATLLVILVTVVIYGLTAGPLARRLGLASTNPQGLLIAGANRFARELAAVLQREGFRVVLVDNCYAHVQEARSAGLTACYTNVLSEHVFDSVDFSDLGRFLALTSNDEVNTLAAASFSNVFGRKHVYQLPSAQARHPREESDVSHLAGRTLFGRDCNCDEIEQTLERGGKVKVTRLSSEFDHRAFQQHYGEQAWPMFVIQENRIDIVTDDATFAPRPGQLVVSLILPAAMDESDRASQTTNARD